MKNKSYLSIGKNNGHYTNKNLQFRKNGKKVNYHQW
jgi:hypothetical protein